MTNLKMSLFNRNCKIWAEIHLHNVQPVQLEMIVSIANVIQQLVDLP